VYDSEMVLDKSPGGAHSQTTSLIDKNSNANMNQRKISAEHLVTDAPPIDATTAGSFEWESIMACLR
jgi:hypothetical protein